MNGELKAKARGYFKDGKERYIIENNQSKRYIYIYIFIKFTFFLN